MTDMKITGCVPLPGPGLVARHGDLIAVTEGGGPGPDPLLGALDEVAATAGDGAALVLAVARAMLAHPDQGSGACAGITAGGEVAVLVHGNAVAGIAVDGGQEVQLTANGSMLPVNRTFAGATVTIRLAIGAPGGFDDRLRLDGGVVYAGGLAVTASTDPSQPVMAAPVAPVVRQPAEQVKATGPSKASKAATLKQSSAEAAPVTPAVPVASDAPGARPAEDFGSAMTVPPATPPATVLDQAGGLLAQQETYLPADQGGGFGQDSGFGQGGGFGQDAGFGQDGGFGQGGGFGQDGGFGQGGAEGWSPPIEFMPSTPPVSRGPEPQLHEPDPGADFEWISLGPQPDPHDHAHAEADVPPLAPEGAEPAMVEGVLCARNHFNDPNVAYCRQCGISMVQQTRRNHLGQRPPLGVLLLDDGTGFTLDRDYVLGREPVLDGDVAAGRARPLRVTDPDGTVGRVHLRVSLVGWQVEVKDLGSVNGSVLHLPAGERKLNPYDPVVVEPGARIGIGQRSIQYLSYRAG
jgi:hypothetical protein